MKTRINWQLMLDGEANFHGIATKENWLMRIQFNGELPISQQLAIMKKIKEIKMD